MEPAGGGSLIVNTHLDVVPASSGQDRPFDGRVEDGVVFGRGACDCKGQAAMFYLALAAIKEMGIELKGDLIGHLVIEEECGGNGTLAFVRGEDPRRCCAGAGAVRTEDPSFHPRRGMVHGKRLRAGRSQRSGGAYGKRAEGGHTGN